MRNHSRFSLSTKTIIATLACFFLFTGYASARKIYLVKGGDGGIAISGTNFNYAPGDTFVLRASQNPYYYLAIEKIHGTAAAPVVVINEGGQVQITAMGAKHCTFMKFTGTGSGDQYGF